MKLAEQVKLVDQAQVFFDGKLKKIIEDNQRRYRMRLKDESERTKRGLSAIPSTKSTAAVDRFVERSVIEYHQDPDAISFTSKSVGDPSRDRWAKLLSEDFRYRSKSTNNGFNFFLWNQSSLTSCAVDGIECNLYRWEKDSYKEKEQKYFSVSLDGNKQEVPKDIYEKVSVIFPEMFVKEDVETEYVCTDTFMIDQLKPGEEIVWDPKIPFLDVQKAEFLCVFLDKSIQDIKNMAASGLIDELSEETIKKYQKNGQSNRVPTTTIPNGNDTRTLDNPNDIDLNEYNRVKLWLFFYKEGNRKMVHFSLDGKEDLGAAKAVDDAFFGGRKVNRYPVTIGTTKLKLWEHVGRSIPETIAPIEDEHIDHKNNINDAAKIAIQGRYRLDPDSDINVDDLLNGRAFYADKGSYDRIEDDFGVMASLRANDTTVADIMELVPAGMMTGARGLVAKGTNQTLGAKQLGKMESDEKLGVAIMTRNETSLKQGLYLIAQLIMAFETNETVLRIAGEKAGVELQKTMNIQGKSILDLSVLDFDVDVEINAGLGSSNRDQKASNTMQLIDWGKGHGVNVDSVAAFHQLSILAGYAGDQLIAKTPPPQKPPEVDYKLNLTMTFGELMAAAPHAAAMIEQKLLTGQASVDTKIKEDPAMNEARQNGGGMMIPNRTSRVVDATGAAAMGMSEGGQQS
ncbi:MAG: hypothetical protein PHI31_09740 [Desulfuromonadaceae bacterium]|nr:hypothetical protein [Desulfuromonadaceae bacterium]